ncbi:MAG: hypothetical protein ACAH17_02710 [Candidatus Paceibacterota bacterium]
MEQIEEEGGGVLEEVARRRDWVKKMKANKHVEGTDDAYAGKIADFVTFLFRTSPDALAPSFREAYEKLPPAARRKKGQQETRRSFVYEQFSNVDKDNLAETAMLDVEKVTEDLVLQWFAAFKGRGGSTPSKSVFGVSQSALVDLFKRHGKMFPEGFYANINDVRKGAQRKRTQEKVDGLVPMEEGKAAIPGYLYLDLAEAMMRSGEEVFCHAFAVCSWVLMSRVSNIADLRGAHFSWESDSLVISIIRHKADQEGERTDPKHCYANPFNPNVCVVTALAIFFAVYGVPKDPRQNIFEGKSQEKRFIDALRRILAANPNIKAEMDRLSLTVEDIASHSFRKGARSYCQGGTTGGPSTPSILLRGGWALEGIDKKYVRYEAAADQFIGRILAMLSISSSDFAALHPHFDVVDEAVLCTISACFPGAPKAMEGVLVQCLASLVYHRDFLRRNLKPDHAIFKSVLFAQGLVDKLSDKVALSFATDNITPSGIPPHVSIQRELGDVKKIMVDLPTRVRAAISEEFEQRAVDSGSITRNTLEQMLESMMLRLQSSLVPQQLAAVARNADDPMQEGPFQTWLVNGQLRRVPESFSFDTTLPTQTMFQLYCLGDRNSHICPYRKLESTDLPDLRQKKRLSDMFALLGPVEAALKRQKQWQLNPTIDQVNEMWELGAPIIAVDHKTPKGRERRLKQLAWSTHLREYRKRPREAEGDDQDGDHDNNVDDAGDAQP